MADFTTAPKMCKCGAERPEGYTRCKPCNRTAVREWRQKNPSKARVLRYEISGDEFDALVALQGGRCAICDRERKLVVDHDHATGRVRGLLCHACNMALDQLGDGTFLQRALDYVQLPSLVEAVR